jgi:hypothetical protein
MTPVKYGARALQESPAKQFSRVLLMTAVTHGTPNRSKVDHIFLVFKGTTISKKPKCLAPVANKTRLFQTQIFPQIVLILLFNSKTATRHILRPNEGW